MTYLIYVIFALIAALYLSMKTDRKLLGFVLIFWMLAQPVLNSHFGIKLPGFSLPPNRVLFLFSLAYLFVGMILGLKAPVGAKPPFEKYVYIYFVLVAIALVVNYSQIAMYSKEIFSVPLEIACFLAVYTVTKRYMTEKVFEAIIKAIILLAVVCALIALVQYFIEPTLLRTRDVREAFGDKFRSTAIFESEYDFGIFQILAFIVVLIRYQGKPLRFFLAPLLAFSVLLTFHRLDFIILYVCFVTYLVLSSKHKVAMPVLFLATIVPAILFLGFEAYQSMGGHSAIVEQRLAQDTVSGRFQQYRIVWDAMLSHPLGMGSYENPAYFKLMDKYNMLLWLKDEFGVDKPHPLAVHNGYLAVGIQYGILATFTFTLLVFSLLRYFKKRITPGLKYSIVPFFVVFIYILANLSNSLSIFRAYFVVLLAIMSGASIALYRMNENKQHSKSVHPDAVIKPL